MTAREYAVVRLRRRQSRSKGAAKGSQNPCRAISKALTVTLIRLIPSCFTPDRVTMTCPLFFAERQEASLGGRTEVGNKSLGALYRAITHFPAVHPSKREFPVQHLLVFLYVSIHERKTIHEIYTELGMAQGTVSRIVQQLSIYRNRKTGQLDGLNLLRTERDLDYPQRVAVTLTPKGEHLKQQLMKILEGVEV